MRDSNELRFVPWEKCCSRAQELQSVKSEPSLKTDAAGHLRLSSGSKHPTTDVACPLRARVALQRRGLAFDQCRLMTYECHERWVSRMFEQLHRTPPAGFAAPSMDQLLKADQEWFRLLAAHSGGQVQARADGSLPLDEAASAILHDPHLSFFLLPMASHKRQGEAPTAPSPKKPKTTPKAASRPEPRPSKGSAKGSRKSNVRMPEELRGLRAFAPGNKRICFAWNMPTGCSGPREGCDRGVHVCAKCLGHHSYQECSQRTA